MYYRDTQEAVIVKAVVYSQMHGSSEGLCISTTVPKPII